jgi:hypothetical protein
MRSLSPSCLASGTGTKNDAAQQNRLPSPVLDVTSIRKAIEDSAECLLDTEDD